MLFNHFAQLGNINRILRFFQFHHGQIATSEEFFLRVVDVSNCRQTCPRQKLRARGAKDGRPGRWSCIRSRDHRRLRQRPRPPELRTRKETFAGNPAKK